MYGVRKYFLVVLFAPLLFLACVKGCDARFATPVPEAKEIPKEHDLAYYQKLLGDDWETLKSKIKEQWAHITDLDLTEIEGSFEKLSNKLQLKYKQGKEEADKWIKEFLNRNKD